MILSMRNDPIDKEIGKRIRGFRKARGWTQHDLAVKLQERGYGVSRSSIVQMELGERRCPLSRAFQLANVLGTTVQQILGDDISDPQQLRALELLERVPPQKREEVLEVMERLARLYSDPPSPRE
jgi:transcriptional regulator with XRE-family HTH domain